MSPIWRLLYRSYRVVSWARYWARRRFTLAGLTVTGSLVVTMATGMNTENMVAYQAFTLLLFMLLVAVSFGWKFRAKFGVTRKLPRFGTVGQPFNYPVLVKNLTTKNQSDLTLIDDLVDVRPTCAEWCAFQRAEEKLVRSLRFSRRRRPNPFKLAKVSEAAVPNLLPGEEREVRVAVTPLRRGVLHFSGVTLARPDPLGLFRALGKFSAPQTTLVLPRRYPLPRVALPGSVKYQEGGVAMASHVGQSEEFVALREYRRGDPLRHIHWRSWAKTGKPIVKEFEDEFFMRHALVLDTFIENPHSEVFEEAVSVAASFACTISTQESLLDLLFVGTEAFCFTAGRGLAHADQMLEILASVRVSSGKPFSTLESLVLNHASVVSGCICVLLAWDAERRAFVRKLQALGVPVMVLVVVPPGAGAALNAGPLRDGPERFITLELGQIEQGLAKL